MKVIIRDEVVEISMEEFEKMAGINTIVRGFFKESWTVDEWLKTSEIRSSDLEQFPNAKIAANIKNTPLYKKL